MGRVPYFRMDWSAFFVSTCWIHRSLLLPWYATNAHGFRYLPKEWLYGLKATRKGIPIFFEDHLRLLDDFEEGATRIYGGLDPREVTKRFARLQSTLEKQSSAPIPVCPQGVDPQLRLRRIAYEVATVAVGPLWGVGPHSRNNVKIAIEPESYELLPVPREPEIWSHPTHAIRRVVDLNRRRTFLWVVAMSLGGTKEFGALLCPEGRQQSWRQWWTDCLIPMAGKPNRKRFEGEMARLSRRLDGAGRRRPRFS